METAEKEVNTYTGGDSDAISSMIAETMEAIEEARIAVEEKNFVESRSKLRRADELLEASRNRVRILEEMKSEE